MAFQNTIKLRVTSTPKHRVAKVKCRIVKYDFNSVLLGLLVFFFCSTF